MPPADAARFDAIFFDLFNTLLHFDFSRLPEVGFDGEVVRTTSLEVHRQVRDHFSVSCSHHDFFREFIDSQRRVVQMRGEEYREIPAQKRFEIIAERLGIGDEGAAELMVRVHMDEMYRCMYFPDAKKEILDALADHPLILVSNFDHGPTAWRALREFELDHRFEAVFISDDVGWRKPGERLFEIVLESTQYTPECCLYVGDDPAADADGAGREGFQVAWLSEKDSRSEPALSPRWVVRDFAELLGIVNSRAEG